MRALILGAGGFIGSHMVERLKYEGYFVVGVDLKYPEFGETKADRFHIYDLRESRNVEAVMRYYKSGFSYSDLPYEEPEPFDEIYQFAADMGGAGFVFSGENDADIMHNSALINLNVCQYATTEKIFYSSSACIYPEGKQMETDNPGLHELDAYPANPDSDYGWEKLFSERLYLAYARNKGLNVRIARFHNIYGPKGTYDGGREKAPAAMCRKAIRSTGTFEVWGTGQQTRSFLYIGDCIEAVRRLMNSKFTLPINIGSEEAVSINQLASMAINLSDTNSIYINVEGPIGVNGRNSDNSIIRSELGWEPQVSLEEGLKLTYEWILEREKQS